MAERRMFAKRIIDTDMFLDMPATAQLLYFHLGMRADDDGFINNPKRIMRDVRCGNQDMQSLIANGYIIPFDTGVIVISHWRMHNYLRSDRYTPTDCETEKAQLLIENKKPYRLATVGIPTENQQETNGIPNGRQSVSNTVNNGDTNGNQSVDEMDTQVSSKESDSDRERGVVGEDTVQGSELTDDIHPLIEFYEKNIEILTPYKMQLLETYVADYSYEWVDHALRYMATLRVDKRNSRYLGGVLLGWRKDNVPEPWKKYNSTKGTGTKPASEMADNVIRMMEERGYLNDGAGQEENGPDTGSMS